MAQTISSILETMKKVIESQEYKSPAWWLDEAQKLAVLRQDLQSELVKAEIQYRNEIVMLTEKDIPYNKAENMIKGRSLKSGETHTSYQWYNYLRTRDNVVSEIIMIAKKRASVNQTMP